MTGNIPADLGDLANLRILNLDKNRLSGSVPSHLSALTRLEWLYLSNNSALSGPLPETLTRLTVLEKLWLHGTSLCAPTAATFQNWLAGISTKSGVVNCVGAPVGTSGAATDRAALTALYNATGGPNWLDNTGWLTSAPLADWSGITTNGRGRVTEILFPLTGVPQTRGNNLRGTIPAELGNLTELETLVLMDNPGLSGPLPSP